jgi:hypothetical protein
MKNMRKRVFPKDAYISVDLKKMWSCKMKDALKFLAILIWFYKMPKVLKNKFILIQM